MMNFAQLRKMDIANGEGIRVSLFTSGCTHKCPGCFNEIYQDFSYGKPMSEEVVKEINSEIEKGYCSGLTLLGGEPFQAPGLSKFIRPIRDKIDEINRTLPHNERKKDIWAYSGYTYEEIINIPRMQELLVLCDVLIDGLFVEGLKDLRLKFRGSSNQRIIDVKKSIENGEVILYEL